LWQIVGCLALSLFAARAGADESGLGRARTHFEAGETLYRLGDLPGAVREFSAGYALAPKPEFLINLAQTYRQMGDMPRARAMFERFLSVAPEDHPLRDQVRATLDELPVVPPPAPAPTVTTLAPAAQPSRRALDPSLSIVAPPPSRRHLALWLVVAGAIVVAAGTALALGLTLSNRGPAPSGGNLLFIQ
jgi:tetratricopeptide (TPR) repeat protein